MAKQYGLLVNLDKCVGCYVCEVGCAEWHNLPPDKKWIRLKTIGPERLNGRLKMEFIPIATEGCTFCKDRLKENLAPFCVATCITQALEFGDDKKILELLSNGKQYQICKLGILE